MVDLKVSKEDLLAVHKTIGANVKKYRKLKNMSQLELSYAMGYKSVSLVSAAELANDHKHFNIEHLYKISLILEVDLCVFFENVLRES